MSFNVETFEKQFSVANPAEGLYDGRRYLNFKDELSLWKDWPDAGCPIDPNISAGSLVYDDPVISEGDRSGVR